MRQDNQKAPPDYPDQSIRDTHQQSPDESKNPTLKGEQVVVTSQSKNCRPCPIHEPAALHEN